MGAQGPPVGRLRPWRCLVPVSGLALPWGVLRASERPGWPVATVADATERDRGPFGVSFCVQSSAVSNLDPNRCHAADRVTPRSSPMVCQVHPLFRAANTACASSRSARATASTASMIRSWLASILRIAWVLVIALLYRNLNGLSRDLNRFFSVSYTHLRAHETVLDIVCRLLLAKKKKN